jgi:triosephosphate isomerase (TIM)
MFKTIGQTVEFLERLRPVSDKARHCDVVIAPPFTALQAAAHLVRGSAIRIGAQDLHWEKEGAHTGDVSATMLVDAGCTFVIIGHSERRRDHGETDLQVNKKLKAALDADLLPIVCVGETLEEREAGETVNVLTRQFQGAFAGLTPQAFSPILIAYEPVWAIGTGRTATPQTAAESHRHLRALASRQFGETLATELRVLYGGSVNPGNIKSLMAQDEIDGALVGGASLNVDSFGDIVNYA